MAGGTLFVVATPIGNLGDVTLRALEVLRSVDLIAAEDTRMTRRLLTRHGIEKGMVSYHARSGRAREEQLLDHLRAGRDLALTTDAGTPSVSDPGDDLVRAWAAEGGRVVPIPGPSAVLGAVVGSGLAGPRWAFEGFLPRAGRERRDRMARIAADDRATVLFEAPGRLARTLADLATACGPERAAAVCRELTKLHEQIARGTLESLIEQVADGSIPTRGEVAIVVSGRAVVGSERSEVASLDTAPPAPRAPQRSSVEAARERVAALVLSGVGSSEAARRIAAETGIPRRQLYAARDAGARDGAPRVRPGER